MAYENQDKCVRCSKSIPALPEDASQDEKHCDECIQVIERNENIYENAERIANELKNECDGSYVGSETTETITINNEIVELFVVAFWEKSFWFEWKATINEEEYFGKS